jgi:hypothetical protein
MTHLSRIKAPAILANLIAAFAFALIAARLITNCPSLSAQTQSASQTPPATPAPAFVPGKYRIAGTIVNAVTGEPIRRASVTLLSEVDTRTVESVLSDNQGHFELSGLSAAKYQLTASKRGYRTAYFDEHEEYSSAIVTGDDQDTGSLIFKLTPGAILHGVVTSDGGDPVESARVMLFLKPSGHKRGERISQADNATTDDSGAFEFSDLAPGDYLLAVAAEPWYAMHQPSGASGPSASSTDPASAFDVVYPITYFDSTNDEASASPIALAAGATEQANIALHAAPALHIFVHSPRQPDGSNSPHELAQSIFGFPNIGLNMGQAGDSRAPDTLEFTGVAPGHYQLTQGDPPRIVELDATASQQVDPALGTATVEVSGSIKSATGAAPPNQFAVSLESISGEHLREPMQMNAVKAAFRFPSVAPGKWMVSVQDRSANLAVVSTTVGSRTQAGSELTVADRPLHVTITVNVGDVRVDGFVKKDGKGFAGAMVVLVPKDLAQIRELARRDQSDSDGSFSLRNAVPGQYTVVAIQNGWDLDWSQPGIIARFLPRGSPVTVVDAPVKRNALSGSVVVQSP